MIKEAAESSFIACLYVPLVAVEPVLNVFMLDVFDCGDFSTDERDSGCDVFSDKLESDSVEAT